MADTSAIELTESDLLKTRAAIEYCYDQGWSDGSPAVPPVADLVEEFLSHTPRDRHEVLCSAAHLGSECTVYAVAINGALAGCRPEYMPILVAMMEAFEEIGPVMAQSATGRAFAVIVNGPIRDQIELNYGTDVFGPGSRANATIGRALRLILYNVFDVRPDILDQSTQGTPGKYSLCFGEHEEANPWEPLHVELGMAQSDSTVTVIQVRGSLFVDLRTTQKAEAILHTLARSMSYPGWTARSEVVPGGNILETNGILHKRLSCLVALGPEHARHLADQGWNKTAVRQFLWEHWGNSVEELRLCDQATDVDGADGRAFVHAAESPETITIMITGADNAGVSTVFPSPGRRIAGPKRIQMR